jgi:hypothetical protein
MCATRLDAQSLARAEVEPASSNLDVDREKIIGKDLFLCTQVYHDHSIFTSVKLYPSRRP